MDVILGKQMEEIDAAAVRAAVAPYRGVLVDLGTGSGRFVYKVAQHFPDLFCIGLDAVSRELQEYATKVRRSPARGGLPNAMFVRAAAEDTPAELAGLATHLTVNLPWGSLLKGIVLAQPEVMGNLLRLAASQAGLEFLVSYSSRYEPQMMAQLGLPELTREYLEQHLTPAYAAQGIFVQEIALLDNATVRRLPLAWGRRLAFGRERQFVHIIAGAGGLLDAPIPSLLRALMQ